VYAYFDEVPHRRTSYYGGYDLEILVNKIHRNREMSMLFLYTVNYPNTLGIDGKRKRVKQVDLSAKP
jgi:hypothetical protein